jgi:hypothetical protein
MIIEIVIKLIEIPTTTYGLRYLLIYNYTSYDLSNQNT